MRWVSLEGRTIVPSMRGKVSEEDRPHFVLGLDGDPVAISGPHGAWADWL